MAMRKFRPAYLHTEGGTINGRKRAKNARQKSKDSTCAALERGSTHEHEHTPGEGFHASQVLLAPHAPTHAQETPAATRMA
jgi:hypothetical protein